MRVLLPFLLLSAGDDLESLKKQFDAEKDKTYVQRVSTISKIGALKTDDAADFLLHVFEKDKDESVRSYALTALGTCGTDKATAKLLAIAKDKSAATNHRSSAMSALGRSKNKDVLDLLVSTIKDRENTLRTSAAAALQQYPIAETEAVWRDLLNDPNVSIVGYALRALGPLKDAKVLEIARKILEDPKETYFTKSAAVDCWKGAGGPEMVKVLLNAAAASNDSMLARSINEALAAAKTDTEIDALLEGLARSEAAVRGLVARILAKVKGAKIGAALLATLEKEKTDDVRVALLDALADRKETGIEELLRKEAAKAKPDDASALAAIRLLAGFPSKESIELLTKLAEKGKGAVEIGAIDALGQSGSPDAFPVLKKALKHKEWAVRAAAIRGLGLIKTKEAVDLLIEQLGKEDGRLVGDVVSALGKLTGNSLGAEPGPWKTWWKVQREGFVFPAKGGAGGGVAGGATYCGIPVTSKKIIFCLDISGSMSAMAGTESRLEQAKKELATVVKQLDGKTSVNLIFFDNKFEAWQKQMVPIKSNLEGALKKIGEQKPSGGTNIYDPLESAFGDPNVDTIYLLSDGAPGSGKFVNTEDILREIKKLNTTRQIVIHTISLGVSDFMKKLAEQNGGQYVEKK